MATTGEKYPTGYGQIVDGDVAWVNTDRIVSSNNSYATSTLNNGNYSYKLRANFDFSAIPVGATIDGVTVRIECYTDFATKIWDDNVYLLDTGGAVTGDNNGSSSWIATSDTVYTYGGAADKWGCALTDTWVKDADFGVAVQYASQDDAQTIYVDTITMEIAYTPLPSEGGAQVITARPFYGPMFVRCS